MAASASDRNDVKVITALASRIYGGGSLLLHQSGNEGLALLIQDILNLPRSARQDEEGTTATFLMLLTRVIGKRCEPVPKDASAESHPLSTADGSICVCLDALPAQINNCTKESDANAIICCVRACLVAEELHGLTVFSERLQTNLSKLISACTRCLQLSSSAKFEVGCRVVEQLAVLDTHIRSGLSAQLHEFTAVLTRTLTDPAARTTAHSHAILDLGAHTLACVYALESTEQWCNVHWRRHLDSCQQAAAQLGIGNRTAASLSAASTPTTPTNRNSKKDKSSNKSVSMNASDSSEGDSSTSHGIGKALVFERVFAVHCLILQQMLSMGCSGGFGKLDVMPLLRLGQVLFPIQVSAHANDAKSLIENDQGIAPADLIIVVSQLKIQLVNVLRSVLETSDACLKQHSSQILSLLSSLCNTSECLHVPQLLDAATSCLSACAHVFPFQVAQTANYSGGCVHALLSWLQTVITRLTDGTALPAGAVFGSNLIEHTTVTLLGCLEALIITSGAFLSAAARTMIQAAILRPCLEIICKGVQQLTNTTDKRLRWVGMMAAQQQSSKSTSGSGSTGGEHGGNAYLLRRSHALQLAVLRTASAECLLASATGSGVLSPNVCLLKAAATSLASSSHPSEVAMEAKRVLLSISSLLHPTCTPFRGQHGSRGGSGSSSSSGGAKHIVQAALVQTLSAGGARAQKEADGHVDGGAGNGDGMELDGDRDKAEEEQSSNIFSLLGKRPAATVTAAVQQAKEGSSSTTESSNPAAPEATPKSKLEAGNVSVKSQRTESQPAVSSNNTRGADNDSDDDELPAIV